MSDFNHLKTWCDKYYEDNQLRIHPANVPQEIILNEILGRLAVIESRLPESMKAPVKKEVIEMVTVRGVEIPLSELMGEISKKKAKK